MIDVDDVDDPDTQPVDEDDDDQWGGLRPLDPDDLVALDPAALEADLVDDDFGAIDSHGTHETHHGPPEGPASVRTADDLTSDTVLRSYTRPPQAGWRRLIHQLTGGTVTPRQSRGDRERADQLRTIRNLVTHPRRITVLSRKGGVGKTTTTLMLGQTLASERGDRIIAVDGNPDAGNLGYRIQPYTADASITDLLNELENITRYADIRRFTTQTPAGLEVLRSDDDPQISTALGDQEYGAIMSLLDRFYNLVLIDTGTGILDSAVQGILDGTDQIVLVVSPSLDAARAASQTLDWLTEHGFVELVENAVTVINQTRKTTLVDVARIEDHFWDRCGATVRIPWDSYLEAGAETDLEDLRPATRDAYRHLAAAVARRFDT
ncbi:MAG: MinD/ParA family protein [Actinobacteria bacterium]|nr:MinD/ParA family protein [Actinomycetota bacterium]